MSIDHRTRLMKDIRHYTTEEVLDVVLPRAITRHGDLAGRGARYRDMAPLGLDVDGR